MADSSILIKDANGSIREVAADLDGAVYTFKHLAYGPLTNDELRASPVPVSGPLTNTQLRDTPVPISGALTDDEIRATPLAVSGPVTNTQMRATPLDVVGPATNTELRASPLTVTEANDRSEPVTCGKYTLAAEASATIAVPGSAVGVRLFAITKNVLFRLDAAPVAPVADTLGAGGFAVATQLRVVRFNAAVTNLHLLSTEGGGGASTDILVEFFE